PSAITWVGYIYELMGNYKEAIEQWTKLASANREDEYAKKIMQAFEQFGYRGFLKQDAAHFEAQQQYGDAAADYATLGDKNAAFAALEKAFAKRVDILFIKVDPQFDSLRSDPRFADLLHRIGLPQ
ncbi:MAG TPA: hypothetical protein VKG87_11675, partial [Terriglobales bacterium]|nr:hypothetical protein [Terriglobales bacterium]